MIEEDHSQINILNQSDLLNVNRSSVYYVKNNNNPTEVEIKHRIDEIYTEVPFYWYRKITEQLKREGLIVNHKRVLKYMREMQIKAIYPGPNLSRRNHKEMVYTYLLRDKEITAKNQVLGINITYNRNRVCNKGCKARN